ncbi:Uncharacterized protein TCM_016397 [Theobroma cacao]|uniref:Uncharacterized protein n=1 Tax=Theobroma cacao TaxID=3641 RepID=A0A061G687_THECC|nr:Uncharacterized protein TCM_016397 [Theobroma cacao]
MLMWISENEPRLSKMEGPYQADEMAKISGTTRITAVPLGENNQTVMAELEIKGWGPKGGGTGGGGLRGAGTGF